LPTEDTEENEEKKGESMFHAARVIAFVACLAAAIFVNWQTGLTGLIVAIFVIPNPIRRSK
jgi:hypothetical protein